ncbi:MAG: FAD-dependent oxidoreductase, partial [Solirubrobacteraceae bacterium]
MPAPVHPTTRSAPRDRDTPVVVVGAGAAGMFTALRAAEAGARVVLVSRKRLAETVRESASFWAQGGLAAALTG